LIFKLDFPWSKKIHIEKQNLEIEHHNENSEKIILKNIQGSNEFDKKRKNLIDFIENLYHKLLAAT
jgi:hypothetical protein